MNVDLELISHVLEVLPAAQRQLYAFSLTMHRNQGLSIQI